MTHNNSLFYYCSYDERGNEGSVGDECLGANWTGDGDNE
jgi:hypothetical protein